MPHLAHALPLPETNLRLTQLADNRLNHRLAMTHSFPSKHHHDPWQRFRGAGHPPETGLVSDHFRPLA